MNTLSHQYNAHETPKHDQTGTFVIRQHIIEVIFLVALLFFGIGLGAITAYFVYSIKYMGPITALENYEPQVPTRIYDRKGRLISEYFIEKREPITLQEVPDHIITSLISIEDPNFYHHKGFDTRAIFRAIVKDILAGSKVEGASTLTMQLPRNIKALGISRTRSYIRKIKELWYAMRLEYNYTKQEILEMYLNEVYLGHGMHGIEAAARFYYDKHVNELTLAEGALLVGLPAAPNKYSPLRNPEKCRQRHWKVFRALVRNNVITAKEAHAQFYAFWDRYEYEFKAKSSHSSAFGLRVDNAPYFTEYIRQKLLADNVLGATATQRSNAFYGGGLKIYTTLDLSNQTAAQEELNKQLIKQNEIYFKNRSPHKKYFDENFVDEIDLLSQVFGYPAVDYGAEKESTRFINHFEENLREEIDLISTLFGCEYAADAIKRYREINENLSAQDLIEGAVITLDVTSGGIRAMVGGSGFRSDNQLNRAVSARRQVGSAFKPFVYLAALETLNFTPGTLELDAPMEFYNEQEKTIWNPNNYAGKYRGWITLRQGLKKSVNMLSIKLADKIGLVPIINMTTKLTHMSEKEKKTRFQRNLSLALGTCELTPMEMCVAFSILANRGFDVTPYTVEKIIDRNGTVIVDHEAERRSHPQQVITPQLAYLITDMMTEILSYGGTAYGAVIDTGWWRYAAGKTGTTDNWRDAWFIGYTPQLCTAVYVGFDAYGISLGLGQEGGKVAGAVWCRYMKRALSGYKNRDFAVPDRIVKKRICAFNNMLAGPEINSNNTYDEVYIEGTEPTDYCITCESNKVEIKTLKDWQRTQHGKQVNEDSGNTFKMEDDDW